VIITRSEDRETETERKVFYPGSPGRASKSTIPEQITEVEDAHKSERRQIRTRNDIEEMRTGPAIFFQYAIMDI
jgi:hypothetical protein